MKDTGKESYNKKELIERGWTEAAIRDFAGEPDQTQKNPIYSTSAPMKLYEKERIKQIEETAEFIDWKRKSEKRRKSASLASKKVADRKKQETLDLFLKHPIEVPEIPEKELRELALDHYQSLQTYRKEPRSLPSNPSKGFLDRITVNFLRHQMTVYTPLLDATSGRYGKFEAKQLIRRRVFEEIARIYPYLAQECKKQLAQKGDVMDLTGTESKTS